MSKAIESVTRKSQRTARPAKSKPSRASASNSRSHRVEPRAETGPFGRPSRATVMTRTDLRNWLKDGMIERVDAMMMASHLLATAVQEMRAFLDPVPLAMALAAIGTVPEVIDGEDLVAKVESMLMGVAVCEM